MNKIALVITVLIIGWYGCNSSGQTKHQADKSKLEDTIKTLQSELAQQEDVTKDVTSAKTLVVRSQLFAEKYPQDSMAAVYLFRAADVSRGLGDYRLAIKLWGEVNEKFTAFKRAPDALFLQGFTYDRDLEDTGQAKLHYRKFLEKYPGHPLVKDVTLMLQYLEQEKSPEELIEEFKDKNQ